jgi:hypothetical protein
MPTLNEQRLAFLHFFKAGGTTIRQAAHAVLDKTQLWPVQVPDPDTTADAAASFRFVSGHFPVRLIDDLVDRYGFLSAVQLRDPVDRLTSAYNFWRAHSLEKHPLLRDTSSAFYDRVSAAKSMGPDEFFQTRRFMQASAIDNHYVWSLSGHRHQAGCEDRQEAARNAALDAALARLEQFDFVGITDNALATVNYVRAVFGQQPLNGFPAYKQTADEMSWHEWMEPVTLATRADVEAAVGPLVRMDAILYARARALNATYDGAPSPDHRVSST